jgi:hypothetical protein
MWICSVLDIATGLAATSRDDACGTQPAKSASKIISICKMRRLFLPNYAGAFEISE